MEDERHPFQRAERLGKKPFLQEGLRQPGPLSPGPPGLFPQRLLLQPRGKGSWPRDSRESPPDRSWAQDSASGRPIHSCSGPWEQCVPPGHVLPQAFQGRW